MLNDVKKKTKSKMEDNIAALKRDFHTLRTGKISAYVLDNVKVSYYSSLVPLNQIANVVVTDSVTIRVSPFEKNILNDIEQAILKANIGVTPNNDGNFIILNFPAMTSEQRQKTVKQAKNKAENAKIAIRNNRKFANDTIKRFEKDKEISEDQSKEVQEEIQKITNKFISKIDLILKEKEINITTI